MIGKLVPHPIIVYDLPIVVNPEFLRPETAILKFPNGKTVNVGSICYLHRGSQPLKGTAGRKYNEGAKVEIGSLDTKRVDQVRLLINFVSDMLSQRLRREETVRDFISRFIAFMSWADEKEFHLVLIEPDQARNALRAYVQYLRERVRTSKISINGAARQQNTIITFLTEYLDKDNLTKGINLLHSVKASKQSTIPPSEDSQAKVISICDALFHGLTDLVLESKPYPYLIKMPTYLKWPNNQMWVFPAISWFIAPHLVKEHELSRCPRWTYNHNEGRLATLEELMALPNFFNNRPKAVEALGLARRHLKKVNSNSQHAHRRLLAMQAANAFVILFSAQTGMNWSQLSELSWNNDYAIETPRQLFRAIKWRANNRIVQFEIPVGFMPYFKRYLQLRDYLLDGRECNLLYFKIGFKGIGEISPLKSSLDPTFIMLRRIDPNLTKIRSRQWRAAKSDWLIRNTDPATTALVLQNSEATVLESYIAGSSTSHLEELSDFLNQVQNSIVQKNVEIKNAMPSAVGVCSSFGQPNSLGSSSIIPDCKGPSGCLFCDKYKAHVDEVDARKLISCRYCLTKVEPLSTNSEFYFAELEQVLTRIKMILDGMSQYDAELISRVTSEVEEFGELDAYWARKYELMIELGVVK